MKHGGFTLFPLALAVVVIAAAACGKTESPAAGTQPAASTAPAGSLAWAVGGDWRIPEWTSRDAARHPAETLAFFGVTPSDTVVELWPGGGYYTAILGPWLRAGGGKLIAATPDPETSADARAQVEAYRAAFVARPDIYGTIELGVASRTGAGLAPDGSADAVLTFRNIHNWMAAGYADKIFRDAFKALKPGGVMGVEEHRLPSTREQDPGAATGYVQESYVIQMAEAAGFTFEGGSEINANPKDTADHPLGVWMLPPNLRQPAPDSEHAAGYDAAAYTAIGESDRMTLKFRKPME